MEPWAPARQQADWTELVCNQGYEWPCDEAMAVLWCESRGAPGAYADGNYGLMQINAIHRRRVGGDLSQLYVPEVNVRVAHELWREQGWNPWRACGP